MPGALPAYDYFEHVFATTDWPGGKGTRVTSVGNAQTGPGKRVLLHGVYPIQGATGNPIIQKGDGMTAYFAAPGIIQQVVLGGMDILLEDGLSMAGGTAGSWVLAYRVLN